MTEVTEVAQVQRVQRVQQVQRVQRVQQVQACPPKREGIRPRRRVPVSSVFAPAAPVHL
ncbi:MAG TPA: hypothetical protein VMO26_29570 [Vicinamibacterales bacterium]|nr:hypothetical protein [Vicinamibacterales bacterium]